MATYSNYNASEPSCHASPKLVYRIGRLEVYGSRGSAVYKGEPWDMQVPCLSDPEREKPACFVTSALGAIAPHFPDWVSDVPGDPFLGINWPDGGIPYLTRQWWAAFAKALVEAAEAKEGKEPFRVVAYCMGGHGRTGTFLTLLGHFLGVIPKGACPVTWLRWKSGPDGQGYCHCAVETNAQIDYIAKLTGRDVSTKGSYVLEAEFRKAREAKEAATKAKAAVTASKKGHVGARRYLFGTSFKTNKMLGSAPPYGHEYIVYKQDEKCSEDLVGLVEVENPNRRYLWIDKVGPVVKADYDNLVQMKVLSPEGRLRADLTQAQQDTIEQECWIDLQEIVEDMAEAAGKDYDPKTGEVFEPQPASLQEDFDKVLEEMEKGWQWDDKHGAWVREYGGTTECSPTNLPPAPIEHEGHTFGSYYALIGNRQHRWDTVKKEWIPVSSSNVMKVLPEGPTPPPGFRFDPDTDNFVKDPAIKPVSKKGLKKWLRRPDVIPRRGYTPSRKS